MSKKPDGFKLAYISNDSDLTIKIPYPSDASDQTRVMNHLHRIQWFALNNGGILNEDKTEWDFKFELEEYNCIIRYLNRASFIKSEHCSECATVVKKEENK